MDKVIVLRDFNGSDTTLFGFQPRGKVLDATVIDKDYLDFLNEISFVKEYDGTDLPDSEVEVQNDDTQTFTNEGDVAVAEPEAEPTPEGDDTDITNDYAPVEADEVIDAIQKATNKQELKDAVANVEGLENVKWNSSIAQIKSDLIEAYQAKRG